MQPVPLGLQLLWAWAAERLLLREMGPPARFGSGLPVRAYTAESLLLSGLPVECPPLDLLQFEVEKLWVLRDEYWERDTESGSS